MKPKTFWIWSLGLALAALPLAGGCDQESANSAPATTANTNQPSSADTAGITVPPSPEAEEQQLEDAPGQVVSRAAPTAQNANLTGSAAEVAKLAQAGVDEKVMLSFVTNSQHSFNLSSDAIIYLNDIGVPGSVVTSMIQHDQALKEDSANSFNTASPPVYTNPLVPAPGAATPYLTPGSVPETTESQPPLEVVDNGQPPEQGNGSSTYFYNSLAPYGNWINVGGYGLCWQPTVVVANPGWRPYCDQGYWTYSDCGWYWVSDYSWGWAPFHYGRWFHHNRWGWCWAPDTVWGPAWVNWRYTRDYCGWAPLPPTACFRPGFGFTYFGRHVGFDFGFGLSIGDFSFVGNNFFCDRHLRNHLVAEHHVRGFFDHSFVARGVLDKNRTFINTGIPPSRVAAATHTPIHRMHIRDAAGPADGRFDRVEPNARILTVYRPNLPTPTRETALVGQGVKPLWRNGSIPRVGANEPLSSFRNEPMPGANKPLPAFRNEPFPPAGKGPVRNEAGINTRAVGGRTMPSGNVPPLILRGQHNSTPPRTGQDTVRSEAPAQRLTQPAQPMVQANPTPPAQNNSRVILNQDHRQVATPTLRAQSPPPSQPQLQNQPIFRQEAPRYLQQNQRTFVQPAAPAQEQSAVRESHWTPAAQPRQQQNWVPPAPVRNAPAFHPEPNVPAAPRMETRQAPAIQATPAPQRNSYSTPAPSRGSGQDDGSRRNR
jgi:hypothetical protein